MVFPDLLFALVIGIVFTGIFVLGFGRRGPWASVPAFFVIVFLAAWAGGAWATPIGPPLLGVYWLPYLFVGLLIALLLAAAAPAPQSTVEIEDRETERRDERHAAVAFEMFFWILLVTLLVGVISRYVAWA